MLVLPAEADGLDARTDGVLLVGAGVLAEGVLMGPFVALLLEVVEDLSLCAAGGAGVTLCDDAALLVAVPELLVDGRENALGVFCVEEP